MNANHSIIHSSTKANNLLWLLLCFVLSAPAQSQVYKYVDKDGNVVYSDSPPEEQQDLPPAKLPDLIIQPAVEVQRNNSSNTPQTDATEIDVSIVQPENETTITPGQMSFIVAAMASRSLARGEIAVLVVNGEEHARSNSMNWTLDNLIRGEMTLQVNILDSEDSVLAESDTIRVFVRRPSVIN
jgi:hypothetical protein